MKVVDMRRTIEKSIFRESRWSWFKRVVLRRKSPLQKFVEGEINGPLREELLAQWTSEEFTSVPYHTWGDLRRARDATMPEPPETS